MPRKKKEMGRPMINRYPPKIDASPEEIVGAIFKAATMPLEGRKDYKCQECGEKVYYPDTLYRDGRCIRCTEE